MLRVRCLEHLLTLTGFLHKSFSNLAEHCWGLHQSLFRKWEEEVTRLTREYL